MQEIITTHCVKIVKIFQEKSKPLYFQFGIILSLEYIGYIEKKIFYRFYLVLFNFYSSEKVRAVIDELD